MFSTSFKIVIGYILLVGLLIGAFTYTMQQMNLLTTPTSLRDQLDHRRHITHRIISQLYDAESIGQTLRTGKLNEYYHYLKAMKEVNASIDTLETILTDTLQQARLDTVRTLLQNKQWNMYAVLEAMRNTPTDQIYQEQLDSLIAQQDSLLSTPHIRRKVITHHNSYTIHHKKKGFFKRLADVFAPGKEDSTQVSNVIQEEYTDTLDEVYSPIDTISSMITGIQHKVFQTRQKETEMLNTRISSLRVIGSGLSQRVNQLLENIEHDEQEAARTKLMQEEEIRKEAAETMAKIAIAAFVLVLVFSIVIARDITRNNHYRRELEKAKSYAENLLVAREKLMLTITHDIKAPAGSIIGYIDLLIRLVNDRRQQFYLSNMKSSAQHLLALVTSLLDYHRLEAGKMDLHPVAFNPHELLTDIYNSFLPLAEKKQLQLDFKEKLPETLTLEGDPFRIRQIVENLLSNALKFTAAGGITLQAEYHGNQFVFSVSDTGCGMTASEQERIFKEFTRLSSAQGQEGFGLGLSITRKLVELLLGRIDIESAPGKGSTFKVSMPLPSISPKPAPGSKEPAITLPKIHLRIAIIDDDRIQMHLTEAMLHNAAEEVKGFKVETVCCEQPEELIEQLKNRTFDLVFTDIQMPAMNGFELLHHLRNQNFAQAQSIPVIAITARGDMNENDFLQKGFAGMLQKPFNQSELKKVVKNALPHLTVSDNIPDTSPVQKEAHETSPHTDQPYNFSPLTAFSEDDPEAAKEILRTFAQETQKNMEKLQTAISNKDMEALCATAHKMLPTFLMIEAQKAIPMLKWLEQQRGTQTYTPEAEQAAEAVIAETKQVLACKILKDIERGS
ncbi:response regulator [Phocaeicola plebeius]|jgi:signal transduction histidine kinase/CheY-like chemotaxis protein/HPt (histidine-containing phosphotransfer) domain-containing protein|uniref:histidine kinase n=1 Tax=Phocaeicola plebeius TaxID=310297 RepID=A0A415JB94_9BACT|nr:ATP-binding protein [Phocaeicola plebeius]RHK99649.1 response regulator [Phocaeicola plebeius]RHL17941.1 response regulator [Phocaeicola plebeius]